MSFSFHVLALSTVPDVAGLRRLHDLPASLSDSEVAEYAFQRRRATHVDDLLPPHLQKIAAFALAGFEDGRFTLQSSDGADEASLISSLLPWLANTGAVDRWSEQEASLACLRTRAMLAGVFPAAAGMLTPAPAFGDWFADKEGAADLSVMARLGGMPLTQGFRHEPVWRLILQEDRAAVRSDVELRALCALMLRVRQACLLGQVTRAELDAAILSVRQELRSRSDSPCLLAFEQAWVA